MRFAVLLLLALLPVRSAPAAPGGAPEPADSTRGLVRPIQGPEQLKSLWKVRRQALEGGDTARADQLFEQVVATCRDNGIRSLDAFALSLVREAEAAVEAGELDRAARLLEQAEMLAPGLPEITLAEAALALDRQPLAVHRWFLLRVKAFVERLDDFQRRVLLVGDLALTALIVLAVLACVFVLGQLLRHGLSLYYDLGEVFPVVTKFLLMATVVLLALLPLYYGFGPFLLFFPAAILLWIYQSPSERVLSVVFTVLLGAAPWVLRMGDRLSEAGTGLSQALYALSRNPGDERALERVRAAVAGSPDDWEARVVLGLALKRRGELEPAHRVLSEALEAVDDDAAAGLILNNLGNVRFASGRLRGAEEAYRQAAERLPDAPEPHFNLHRLYQRQARLDDAKQAINRASALAPDRVAAWNDDSDPNLNRFVVDLELPVDQLMRRAFSGLFAPTPLSARLWQVVAGPVPEMVAPLLAVMTLLIAGVLRLLQPRIRITRPCARCALPAPALRGEGDGGRLCEQCTNLFVKNVPVDRRIRFKKEEQIGRYQWALRWGTRLSGVLLPGLAGILRGRPVRGALLLTAALVLARHLLLPHGLLLDPVPHPAPPAHQTAVIAAALGLLWLASAVLTFRLTRSEA